MGAVSIDLTEEGYARWTEVAAALFAYLRMLSARLLLRTSSTTRSSSTTWRSSSPSGNAQDFATAAVSGVAYFDDEGLADSRRC